MIKTVQAECWSKLRDSILSELVWIDDAGPSDLMVTTGCLYPSGEVSQVIVSWKKDMFIVSDYGQGLLNIRAAGIKMDRPGVYLAQSARAFHLSYVAGAIQIKMDKCELIPAAVSFVANASVDAVRKAIAGRPVRRAESFKFAFDGFIKDQYPDRFSPAEIPGKHGVHHMDYVNEDSGYLILDPVTNDDLTIANAVRAHSDISRAKKSDVKQWIVIDADDGWTRSSLGELRESGAAVLDYDEVQNRLPIELAA